MSNSWNFIAIWVEHTDDYPTFVYSILPTGPVDGTRLCPYLANGQARKLVSSVSGLSHLNGQLVNCLCDGQVVEEHTVSGGEIQLIDLAATIHVGLPYAWKMQFLPLGGDGQTINQGKERKMYDVVLRVFKSFGGQFGKDVEKLYPIDYTAQENINRNTDDEVLFTGDLHKVGFESSFLDYWEPVLTDNQPFPFQLLAAIIRSEISEDK